MKAGRGEKRRGKKGRMEGEREGGRERKKEGRKEGEREGKEGGGREREGGRERILSSCPVIETDNFISCSPRLTKASHIFSPVSILMFL